MYARVTEVEVDLATTTIDDVLTRFRAAVLPALQEQPGYRGLYVMGTAEGAGVLVSLWATEASASAIHEGGWYFGVLRDFATVFRDDPERASYEVLLTDLVPGADADG